MLSMCNFACKLEIFRHEKQGSAMCDESTRAILEPVIVTSSSCNGGIGVPLPSSTTLVSSEGAGPLLCLLIIRRKVPLDVYQHAMKEGHTLYRKDIHMDSNKHRHYKTIILCY